MRERRRDDSPRYRQRSRQRSPRSRDNRPQRKRQLNWQKEERKPQNYHPQNSYQNKNVQKIQPQMVQKVNRKQVCPFYVKIFYSINSENTYSNPENVPQLQLSLHLWSDSSLRQISELIRAYMPSVRTKQRFTFSRVHLDEEKKILEKQELGTVYMHRRLDRNDEKYLSNTKFTIGDYLDVSINYK